MIIVMRLARGIYAVAFWILVAILVFGGFSQLLGLTRWYMSSVVIAYCVSLYFLIRRHYGRGGRWSYTSGFGVGSLLILRLVYLAPLAFALRDFVREMGGTPTEEQAKEFVVEVQSRSLVSAEYLGSLFRAEMWPILVAALTLLIIVGVGQAGWIPGSRIRRLDGRKSS